MFILITSHSPVMDPAAVCACQGRKKKITLRSAAFSSNEMGCHRVECHTFFKKGICLSACVCSFLNDPSCTGKRIHGLLLIGATGCWLAAKRCCVTKLLPKPDKSNARSSSPLRKNTFRADFCHSFNVKTAATATRGKLFIQPHQAERQEHPHIRFGRY